MADLVLTGKKWLTHAAAWQGVEDRLPIGDASSVREYGAVWSGSPSGIPCFGADR